MLGVATAEKCQLLPSPWLISQRMMDRPSACSLHIQCIVLQKKPEHKKPNIVSWATQVLCPHRKIIFPKLFCIGASLQNQFKPKAAAPCWWAVQTQSTIDVLDLSPLLLPQPAGPGCPIRCSQDYFGNFLIGPLNSNWIFLCFYLLYCVGVCSRDTNLS